MTQAQKLLLVSFCSAGVAQIALAVYRGRILSEPSWLGIGIGVGIMVSAALRLIADRSRPMQVVSATLGLLALFLGLWLSYGIVEGGVPMSLLEKAGAASSLLTFGIVLAVSRRSERRRAFVASMFFLCVLALEVGVTLDARWEAEQRTRGISCMWR